MSSLALYVLVFLVSYVACNLCTEPNICLVARIVFGEARGEKPAGQLAVAYTVVNRVNHASYPNTVPEVVNQTYNKGRNHQYNTLDNRGHDTEWSSARAHNTTTYINARNAAEDALCSRKSDPARGATNFCGKAKCTAKSVINTSKSVQKYQLGGIFLRSYNQNQLRVKCKCVK